MVITHHLWRERLAAAQSPDSIGHVLVRANPDDTVGAVRAAIARLDADVPMVEVATMQATVDGFSMGERLAWRWVPPPDGSSKPSCKDQP